MFELDTLSVHAGARPDPTTGARATPIYQTTSFVFEDSDHAAALFNMERAGHVYSRLSNPTNAVLEERIAALEGGIGAISVASGQAALHLAIVTLMGAGSHIVASRALYGGSHNLLDYTLPRFGIETTFVDPGDLDAWHAAVRPNTRLFFGETLGNPGNLLIDIEKVAQIAHTAGVPLMLGTGTGSELRRPLGFAMVGGLALSQLLTLFTTPVVYLYLDRMNNRLTRRKGEKPHTGHLPPVAAATGSHPST